MEKNDKGVMSPEEFATRMQKIVDEYGDDIEYRHVYMDELMIEILKQIGYEKGAIIREETGGWYA